MATISKELIEKFRKMDTTSVSDALDRLGIKGGCQGILPQVSGIKMVGTAFTVRYRPCGTVKGTVGDFLDDVQPGQAVVLDNGGRRNKRSWRCWERGSPCGKPPSSWGITHCSPKGPKKIRSLDDH